jgi:hypothetical protein
MPRLPQFQDDNQALQLMQDRWSSILHPFINNPSNNALLHKNLTLTSGDNVINHKLGRKLQGWRVVRLRSAATFYDKQDTNSMPDKTLVLNASANAVIDLEVF